MSPARRPVLAPFGRSLSTSRPVGRLTSSGQLLCRRTKLASTARSIVSLVRLLLHFIRRRAPLLVKWRRRRRRCCQLEAANRWRSGRCVKRSAPISGRGTRPSRTSRTTELGSAAADKKSRASSSRRPRRPAGRSRHSAAVSIVVVQGRSRSSRHLIESSARLRELSSGGAKGWRWRAGRLARGASFHLR
jgi:heme exporter protein D